MKTIIIYTLLCALLFSAGLGVALVLDVKPPHAETADHMEDGLAAAQLSDVVPANPEADLIPDEGSPMKELPVPVHGRELSAEELFRFGAMYKQQQEALALRNEEIERRHARLTLMRDDLAGSRKEFDGLREQVQDAAARTARLIQQLREQQDALQQQQQAVEKQLQNVESGKREATAAEGGNIRQISSWFEGMPPEKAAEYIREICNDGDVDSAVKLLGNLEERNAAKILAAMEDAALVVDLMEAFKHYKREQAMKR